MSDRLRGKDWLSFGLKTLGEEGFTALKADRMARALNVSRGSFYWHFKNLRHFHEALLDHWKTTTTDIIIDDIDTRSDTALRTLIGEAFNADRKLERAIRAWATETEWVGERVASLDKRRITFIEKLLEAQGIAQNAIPVRATVLYWAYLGGALVQHTRLPDGQLDALVDMMLGK
ncbi:MAG: TetR/AcrR family transcriptional regulator [Pseudomonadota bacterium]